MMVLRPRARAERQTSQEQTMMTMNTTRAGIARDRAIEQIRERITELQQISTELAARPADWLNAGDAQHLANELWNTTAPFLKRGEFAD